MYRNPFTYDELDQLAIDLYCDYGFNKFPLDVREVCRKLGIVLVSYSAYEESDRRLLKKRSLYGFLVPSNADMPAMIFYNDDLEDLKSEGCIRQTIFHEVKHYVCGDTDDNDDDLAEHFGKYFACPIPYLIAKNIDNPHEIVSRFGVSMTVAENISSQLYNRKKRYGKRIFDYEKPLIKLLVPAYYTIFLDDSYKVKQFEQQNRYIS